MDKNIWNEPYFDRRTWILANLDMLHMNPQEILVLMLIDYCNQIKTMVTHEYISKKINLSIDEIEEIFMSLSDKGYLTINMDMEKGNLIFDIEGIYQQEQVEGQHLSRSLFDTFEFEFKRPLSHHEMDRILTMVSNYEEERVILALNEAVAYQKLDLNYIERILGSWMQKGLSIEDLQKGKR